MGGSSVVIPRISVTFAPEVVGLGLTTATSRGQTGEMPVYVESGAILIMNPILRQRQWFSSKKGNLCPTEACHADCPLPHEFELPVSITDRRTMLHARLFAHNLRRDRLKRLIHTMDPVGSGVFSSPGRRSRMSTMNGRRDEMPEPKAGWTISQRGHRPAERSARRMRRELVRGLALSRRLVPHDLKSEIQVSVARSSNDGNPRQAGPGWGPIRSDRHLSPRIPSPAGGHQVQVRPSTRSPQRIGRAGGSHPERDHSVSWRETFQ